MKEEGIQCRKPQSSQREEGSGHTAADNLSLRNEQHSW